MDERIPYWAELWPSAIALAEYVSELENSEVSFIHEIGCGMALPSVLCGKLGHKVMMSDYMNTPHFLQFSYTAGFFRYQCEYGKTHSLIPGYPGETGTWLNIIANKNIGETGVDDDWTINGLPVMTKATVQYKEDGYELYYSEPGSRIRGALVS